MLNHKLILRRVRMIADYQFKPSIGKKIFPDNVEFIFSKRTGKIKQIFLDGVLIATVRAKDGFLALSIDGGKRLHKYSQFPEFRVVVTKDVAPYIKKGRSVFAKHVILADKKIRPKAEVLIVDEDDVFLSVGKAVLNGEEMMVFNEGVAVKNKG